MAIVIDVGGQQPGDRHQRAARRDPKRRMAGRQPRDAYAALDAAALRDAGSPYRPQLDDGQVDAKRAALANEVELISGLRLKR